MAVPMLALPNSSSAQKGQTRDTSDVQPTSKKSFVLPHVLEKSGYRCAIEGVENGHTILKDADGRLFFLDEKTGDQKFLKVGYTIKLSNAQRTMKHKGEYKLLGVDPDGNTVMENAKGEKFYLESSTGDMIFVK
jgi:hypothetical protein